VGKRTEGGPGAATGQKKNVRTTRRGGNLLYRTPQITSDAKKGAAGKKVTSCVVMQVIGSDSLCAIKGGKNYVGSSPAERMGGAKVGCLMKNEVKKAYNGCFPGRRRWKVPKIEKQTTAFP